MFLPVATAVSVAVVLLLVLRPLALLTTGLLVWGLNMWQVVPLPSNAILALAATFVLVAILKSARMHRGPKPVPPVAYFLVGASVLGLMLLPASINVGESLSKVLGSISLGVMLIPASRWLPGKEVATASFWALGVYVVLSYAIGFTSEGFDVRWSGATPNPNALGILAFVFVATAFGVSRNAFLLASPLAFGLVLMTASRGGMLAVVAAIAAGLWVWADTNETRYTVLIRRVAVLGALAGGAAYIYRLRSSSYWVETSTDVVRFEDGGRASLIEENVALFAANPWTGYGFGIKLVEDVGGAHTLPVTMAVQLGVGGVILFLALVVLFIKTGWRTNASLAALTAGALASALTESWIFGVGYVMTAAFWLALATLASDESAGRQDPGRAEDQAVPGVALTQPSSVKSAGMKCP